MKPLENTDTQELTPSLLTQRGCWDANFLFGKSWTDDGFSEHTELQKLGLKHVNLLGLMEPGEQEKLPTFEGVPVSGLTGSGRGGVC